MSLPEVLSFFIVRIVAVFTDQENSVNLEAAASLSECLGNCVVDFHARMPGRPLTAEIIGSHLLNVQRDNIHFGTMMPVLPAVPFQKSVDDMF